MRDSALKLGAVSVNTELSRLSVGEELMRDSALKLCKVLCRNVLVQVGEELMRDSALKLATALFVAARREACRRRAHARQRFETQGGLPCITCTLSSRRRRAHARQRFETLMITSFVAPILNVGEELMRDSALKP